LVLSLLSLCTLNDREEEEEGVKETVKAAVKNELNIGACVQVRLNAAALATALQRRGFSIVTGVSRGSHIKEERMRAKLMRKREQMKRRNRVRLEGAKRDVSEEDELVLI